MAHPEIGEKPSATIAAPDQLPGNAGGEGIKYTSDQNEPFNASPFNAVQVQGRRAEGIRSRTAPWWCSCLRHTQRINDLLSDQA
jgi:hypothetical protein